MGDTRIDRRRPTEARTEDDSAAPFAAKSKKQESSGSTTVEHSAGSRQLVAGRKAALPPLVVVTPGAPPPKPVIDGSIPWISIRPDTPKPAPAKPEPRPEPQAPLPAHLHAQKKLGQLEKSFEQTKRDLTHAAEAWEAIAKVRRHAEASGRYAGTPAWEAEYNAELARRQLVELKSDFDAAKHQYEVVLGLSKRAGIGPGQWRDAQGARGYRSEVERFQTRVEQYNSRVQAIKSAGPLAQIAGAIFAVTQEAALGQMDEQGRQSMDRIYQAGRALGVVQGVATSRRHGMDQYRSAEQPTNPDLARGVESRRSEP